ncbi:CHAT domain-containing protein [Nostoc sp.]|uniref:CHAT domain-containing protein n=1 Tax=Nostoc sp. TaxID=1180 RepID=UPI002FFBCA7C
MNEQLQQAYLDLIKSLLNCPSGQEQEILAAKHDLLNAGLLQAMETQLLVFSQRRSEKAANWVNRLRNLINQIAKALKIPLSSPTEDAYLKFLLQLIKATRESRGNAQVVYPLLKNNIDKLDGVLAERLRQWGTNTLKEEKAHNGTAILSLSNLIQQFPLGSKASNMDIAIAGYEVVATIFTPTTFPQQWAGTQNNLAVAYTNRINGDKADNLENAIAACHQALTIRTPTDFPQDWAGTQNNLANAYTQRIKEDKADNLENAIAAFQQALTVYTATAFPQDWATTQNNLAVAYSDRIKGDKADNLEKAIAAYLQALTVRTPTAFPQDWATTQNNLAVAYTNRIKGDKADNLENAITACQQALTVYIPTDFPQKWATTQNNLGIAYGDRIKGDKDDNLENAIAAYKQALTVRTPTDFPQQWAMTQNNLAVAYTNIINGDKAKNLENAITACQQALTVYIPNDFPQQWAGTQNNLAVAYKNRINGDKAENLENAIAAYKQVLTVRTPTAFPQDWATTQSNLANAYSDRINGDKAENLENAIAAYKQALTVRTPTAFPQSYAHTAFNLGVTYQEQEKPNLAAAYQTFAAVITTVETMRGEIISGEETKRKQSEEWNQSYRCMVEVCLALGKKTEAIEYAEQSKTRNLVEQILERDFHTIFPADVITQLEQLRDEIAVSQFQLQNNQAENPKALETRLQQLRQQRKEIQDCYLPIGNGFRFNQFQRSLDNSTAILEWYITERIVAFIIQPTGEVTVWQSQPEDREALDKWVIQYLQNYKEQKEQWKNSLGEELKTLASILHINEILAEIPKPWDKLILIPHQFLHLLPLHALPVSQNSENSPCLLDLFPGGVGYAPSCQLLQQMQQRDRPNFQSLFAIQNPTKDLSFADLEVESILSYFPYHQLLAKEQATKAALSKVASQLKEVNYLHFSCHGFFNLSSPQNSCLVLADSYVSSDIAETNLERYVKVSKDKAVDLSKCLTLGNLFEENLNFSQSRLVVLSACETGLIDFTNTSDEYIGLPSGFLYAGSSSVVSSLWTVNELSTSFLLIKFIQILQDATDMSVPLAMNQAQQWLRDATKEELQEWVKKLTLDSDNKGKIRRQINYKMTGEKPFNSPYHWAAFTAVGK